MPSQPSSRPQWQTNALYSAIAALCTSGLVMSQAQAGDACGPIVSADQGQCIPAYEYDNILVNQGVTISTSDQAAVLYSGNLGFSEVGPVQGSLTNNGSIRSSGLGTGQLLIVGVHIPGLLRGTLTNNGVISGTSNASGQSYAYGISGLAMQGVLRNSGSISATSSSADGNAFARGLDISNSTSAEALIDNLASGRITAEATGQSGYASAVFVDTMGGTLTNRGQISANINAVSGRAAGVFSNSFSGTLNNYGTIVGTATNGGLGYSIYIGPSVGSSSKVNNMQGGVLRGKLFLSGDGVNVNNAGLIDLPMRLDAGYVRGDFTQTATGILRIMADGSGEDHYSQLQARNADIAGKAFVDVKQVNTLAVGQTLVGVVSVFGSGKLTGNFAQVKDNSALFNFKSLATQGAGGHIDFQIVKDLTAVEAVNTSNNPAARGAAGALDRIIDSGTSNPNMQTVIDALGNLGTEQEVSDAVSQTLPLFAGSSTIALNSALTGISRVIESRMDANRGMSSGDEFYGDRKLWLKTFGSWADQDDRNNVSGFDANTAGLVMGADATVSEQTRIGVALAYANSTIDSNSKVAPNSADIDMYQVIGYGSHSLDQNTELNFHAGIGQNNTDGKHDILFLGETAKSDYSSLVATAGLGLGRTFKLNETTDFTPSVRTDYIWIKDEGYTEKGSSANLKVDSQTTDQWIVGIDGKLSHEFMPSTRVVANLGLGYDLLNSQSTVNAAFAAEPGIGFTTRGLDPSPWRQNAGLGVIHDTASGMEVSLRYDAEHSEGFLNQTASVKARWDF
jgi:outer membrane autotransporter protein